MKNYVNKNIKKLKPYKPPIEERRDFDGLLLNFNEMTVPVSEKVREALRNFVLENKIQIYPEYYKLTKKISEYTSVDLKSVLLTNGSDEGINLIVQTFTEKNDKVIIPTPSFAMHNQYCEVRGNEIIGVDYNNDLTFPFEKVLDAIQDDVKLLILCNPNSPIGNTIDLEKIKSILQKALKTNTLVYIDEAYFEFCKITASSLISKYLNLIITRTFSKAFGLASLRLGYLLSDPNNIDELQKVQSPYSVNMAAVVAGFSALQDLEYMNSYVDEVMNKSKPILESFLISNNIKFYKTYANFVLIKPENQSKLYEDLKQEKILVRPRSGNNIEGTVRITIGTVKQTKQLIKILNKIL